ncbi:BTAD domain-containing putative transcriptional regulator [Streptomyces sp. GESEQ-35]|uniref:ATP-binding protein n=1 Tax=Streptomyces sp. GESEQ-35 TaxID=2812657 RepID=UPI001B320C83|nr:BTAD domain-containing putative transcriptional regulator [Streptomyces sp. GESEQ-35]
MTIELTLLSRVAYRGQEITAPRLRGLLALLAEDLKPGASSGRLVEGLWPDEIPERPGKAVQVLVSRARSQLGADVIESTPSGYRLALSEAQVDSSALLTHAATSADRARARDHAASLAAAEAGLALWEGGPLDEEFHDPVAALRAERAPVRRALVRAHALALARLGRHSEAAAPLAEVADESPRDEEVLAELLRVQATTAGPSAALARYETYRRELRDDLGTEPGAPLKAIQQELLQDGAPVVRHGVPHEPNPLLGREPDIAAVEQLLREARAVTVIGPGGLGKTRLSHAVSRRSQQRVVHFVPLAGVTSDEDVAAEVASALGAGEGLGAMGGGPAAAGPVPGILDVLGTGPALLVLDNCEQVILGAADLVQALISGSKDLQVLVTSRAPLGLTSEATYALPELALDTSVELFTQRARAARPGVGLPADAVADLCRHLDGLPLALELAAARVRVLSVPEIARRLGDRFALLRGGARDAPERHRTLHAVVEWSWNLLEEDSRAALRTLSVFPGSINGEAAEHVLGADALSLLEQLIEQSLLTAADTPAGLRFRMLETVREFSAAKRAESGEDGTAIDRFLSWARDFGTANHDVLYGPEPRAGWTRIRAEQDNLVLAQRHALSRGNAAVLAPVTAVLASLWATGSNYPRLVALAKDSGPPLSHYYPDRPEDIEAARAAATLCTAALFMGLGPHAVRQLVVLRRLPAARPDNLTRAIAVLLAAIPEMSPPDFRVLQQLRESEHPLVAGVAEFVTSHIRESEQDREGALTAARRMNEALQRADTPFAEVLGHSRLSDLCLRAGEGGTAYEHLKRALKALNRLGDEQDSIGVRWGLALACLQRGDPDEAEYWLRQAEGGGRVQSDVAYSPELGARAEIALTRGLTEVGLGLWRNAVKQLPETGAPAEDDPLLDQWAREIQSVAVTAHAYAGKPQQVAELTEDLRDRLLTGLAGPPRTPTELPVYGTMLHALGMAAVASGDNATAVRMLALAERLGVTRQFLPTMSAGRARVSAESADGAAYADAVSVYAALGREELWEAVRAVVAVTSRRR